MNPQPPSRTGADASASAPTSTTQEFDARLQALSLAAQDLASGRRSLGNDVAQLSRLFGSERPDRSKDYLQTDAHRAAYLAFFTPRSAAQTARLLLRAQAEGFLNVPRPPRVLDLGSGPLSGILGAWLAFGEGDFASAVDISAGALRDGTTLLSKVAPTLAAATHTEVKSVTANFAAEGPFDLVILSHVLNEIGDPRRGLGARVAVIRRALSRLAPEGRILVVEPATRVHGRALMRLRDEIHRNPEIEILAPCPNVASCPLLARASDWCHADLAWDPPAALATLQREAKLTAGPLKVSTLLLGREPIRVNGSRLVGGLMGRGKDEGRYACSPRGLVTLRGKGAGLPKEVREPMRGSWLVAPLPPDVTIVAPESPRERSSSSRRPNRGPGGGGGRRRR